MHSQAGLWERNPEHKRDWGNVSEHCLVEAARTDIFSDLLCFYVELRDDLKVAAALSDYFKKREKEMTKEVSNSKEAFALAELESHRLLKEAGFSDRVIYLADSTGTIKSISETVPSLLKKTDLNDDDVGYLVLHYIDDYTIGSEWVTPTEILSDGILKNAFDRRMDDLDRRYPELKESGFNDKQREIGLQVEQRLVGIISQRTNRQLNPKGIPEMVDQMIAQRIQSV